MMIGYGHIAGLSGPETQEQIRQKLIDAGADAVFIDAADDHRPALECALSAASRGDTLLALAPYYLARSVPDLIAIADRLTAKGATLRVLQPGSQAPLDTGTPAGAVMLAALSLLAAFERPGAGALGLPQRGTGAGDPSLEDFAPRRPRGRPPTASTKAGEIARLRAAGMRATDIADRLKICRASVYRVLNMHNPVTSAQPANRDADFVR
jgi:DNA invertase Pin-like site-specific DNA recombinase